METSGRDPKPKSGKEPMVYNKTNKTINGTQVSLLMMKHQQKPKLLMMSPVSDDAWNGKIWILSGKRITGAVEIIRVKIVRKDGKRIETRVIEHDQIDAAIDQVNQGKHICLRFPNNVFVDNLEYKFIDQEQVWGINHTLQLTKPGE